MDFKEHVSKTHLSLLVINNNIIKLTYIKKSFFLANLWEEIKISVQNFVRDLVNLIILISLAIIITILYFFGRYKNRMVKFIICYNFFFL
jgi:hypothetical protein